MQQQISVVYRENKITEHQIFSVTMKIQVATI